MLNVSDMIVSFAESWTIKFDPCDDAMATSFFSVFKANVDTAIILLVILDLLSAL